MKFALFDQKGKSRTGVLTVDLNEGELSKESKLQALLFENPSLLNVNPQDRFDPIIPVCRELSIRGASSTVYLDIFAVRASGRPVLVECKLWRNPQARREVVGQILEYAVLIKGQSADELESRIRQSTKAGDFSLYNCVASSGNVPTSENEFYDALADHLLQGSFDLILAGDGIRSDVKAIARFLENQTTQIRSINCLEASVFRVGKDTAVITRPSIEFVSERFKTLVPVDSTEGALERVSSNEITDSDKIFWQSFIDAVVFTSNNQPPPRHGRNHVKIPSDPLIGWFTAYRIKSGMERIGIFMVFRGEGGDTAYQALTANDRWHEFVEELPGLQFSDESKSSGQIFLNYPIKVSDKRTEAEQRKWLLENVPAFVNLFSPILMAMSRGSEN